jgi:ATP-binding protein involved in chromosome partitioning
MPMLTEEIIHQALKTVKYPGFSRDITSFGLVKTVAINGDEVRITLQINTNKPGVAEQVQAGCEKAIGVLPGVRTVRVEMNSTGAAPQKGEPGHDPWSHQNRIPGVQRVIAVASGKGGVGKSTVAVNLACALNHLGAKVGLLDCDIYGPSIPLMMGIRQRPTISAAEKLVPPVNYGIKLMSIGFLVEDDTPVIWRGPMITKTIHQFLNFVEWGELDYLLVDLDRKSVV